MGLDMYLHCNDRELTQEVQDDKWRARYGDIMYWRKANAIHNWFIENADYSDGEDDCKDIHVTVADLIRLCETCEEVLAHHDKAEELLPTTSGFFFGSTEYDEYYFSDIEYTAEKLRKILELIQPAQKTEEYMTFSNEYVYKHNDWLVEFTYRSSW